jgi:DNA-binding response OmpR family regulator
MEAELLVIEDDITLSQLLCEQLQRMGYRVQRAQSWSEAEGILNRCEPDLILLDGCLPDANGIELLPGPCTPVSGGIAYGLR